MAFMMPVMKNNYDIYKDPRSRKTSDCSNGSSNSSSVTTASTPTASGRGSSRIRKVSECKSESFAASPSHVPSYRMQMQRCQSSRAFSRNSSRTSSNALSPTRSFCQAGMMTSGGNSAGGGSASGVGGSPKKRNTIDSNGNGNGGGGGGSGSGNGNGSQNDLSKFHLRLVEKLRKSFRKDSAKRS